MAYKVPPYIKRDGESLLFNNDHQTFVFYIPENFFDTGNATVYGDYVEVFGLLNFAIYDDKDKIIKPISTFNYPTTFCTKPSSIETINDFKISKYAKPDSYRLLKYRKGDKVVMSVHSAQDIENVEAFYKALFRGGLPPTIPYDKIYSLYETNMAMSDNSYGITAQLIGIVISEIYRSQKDNSKPFRLSGSDDMLAYQAINIRESPKMVSSFVSLTSEGWDDAIVGAIDIGDNGKDSPLEDILVGWD